MFPSLLVLLIGIVCFPFVVIPALVFFGFVALLTSCFPIKLKY